MSNQALDEPAPIFKAVNGEVLWRNARLHRDSAVELVRLFSSEGSWELANQVRSAAQDAYGVQFCGACNINIGAVICASCAEDTLNALPFVARAEVGMVGSCDTR